MKWNKRQLKIFRIVSLVIFFLEIMFIVFHRYRKAVDEEPYVFYIHPMPGKYPELLTKRKFGGLLTVVEKRNPSGVVISRTVSTPVSRYEDYDRNEDGKYDVFKMRKKYVGPFRFADRFFDKEFKGREMNGLMVLKEDNNYVGCFETKTLQERDESGENVITTHWRDDDCDGIYEEIGRTVEKYEFSWGW